VSETPLPSIADRYGYWPERQDPPGRPGSDQVRFGKASMAILSGVRD